MHVNNTIQGNYTSMENFVHKYVEAAWERERKNNPFKGNNTMKGNNTKNEDKTEDKKLEYSISVSPTDSFVSSGFEFGEPWNTSVSPEVYDFSEKSNSWQWNVNNSLI